jgi:hypothetical protein
MSARPPQGLTVDRRVVTATTRASTPADDHLSRVRIANHPAPAATRTAGDSGRFVSGRRTSAPLTRGSGYWPLSARWTSTRYPRRSHRFRLRDQLSPKELAAALDAIGATRDPDGRWWAPTRRPRPDPLPIDPDGRVSR